MIMFKSRSCVELPRDEDPVAAAIRSVPVSMPLVKALRLCKCNIYRGNVALSGC